MLFDEYEENWGKLAWVMVRGMAAFIEAGAQHDTAIALLEARYPHYQELPLAGSPVIRIEIQEITGWRWQEPG